MPKKPIEQLRYTRVSNLSFHHHTSPGVVSIFVDKWLGDEGHVQQ